MTTMRKLLAMLFVVCLVFTSFACNKGKDSGDQPGGGNSGGSFFIDQEVYDALDEEYQFDIEALKAKKSSTAGTLYMARAYADELPGWNYVYEVYEKMYPNVTIVSNEYSTGNDMKNALILQMSSSSDTVGLMQGNYVREQLKSTGYNFLGGFLDTVNPYASPSGSDNEIIMADLFDEYTLQNTTAVHISFQKTVTCMFVNTTALAEVGLTKADLQTWNDIVDACALLKQAGYTAPFGIGGNADSINTKDFRWLYNNYLDQYYRDLIDDIQVQPEDYNYNASVAEGFNFTFESMNPEYEPNYAVNSMRAYNMLLNTEADNPYYVGADSAKFKCFLDNLLKIGPYVSSGFATNGIAEVQQSFLRGQKNDAVFMVNYVGYGVALENYTKTNQIDFDWACLEYLPMECSCNVACNDENGHHTCDHVDNAATEDQCTLHCKTTITRDNGGTGGYFGLYTEGKSQDEIELYLDFLRFFLSPYGQSLFYKGLDENGGSPKAMSVIDGALLPTGWANFKENSKDIKFSGVSTNWFTDFLCGCKGSDGSHFTVCMTAFQNGFTSGTASLNDISTTMNLQIKSYCATKLSAFVDDCYKNYTQKPATKN